MSVDKTLQARHTEQSILEKKLSYIAALFLRNGAWLYSRAQVTAKKRPTAESST